MIIVKMMAYLLALPIMVPLILMFLIMRAILPDEVFRR